MTTGHPSARRCERIAGLDSEWIEIGPHRSDPTAYARSLLATLDSLTPEEQFAFHKLADMDRHDPSGLGEP